MTEVKSHRCTHVAALAIGDEVRLRIGFAEGDGCRGMITGLVVRPESVLYLVVWSDTREETMHYGIEIEPAEL